MIDEEVVFAECKWCNVTNEISDTYLDPNTGWLCGSCDLVFGVDDGDTIELADLPKGLPADDCPYARPCKFLTAEEVQSFNADISNKNMSV